MEEVGLRLKGSVRYFNRDDRTGLIVPGTEVIDHNTITLDVTWYLAYKIGTHTIDQSMSNLFTVGGTIDTGDNGQDGIAYGTAAEDSLTHKLDTDLNAGGDNATNYIEYVGSIAGPLNMTAYLQLGEQVILGNQFSTVNAYYNINNNIESGQTFYFYWRLTVT